MTTAQALYLRPIIFSPPETASSSARWVEYFRANETRLLSIPWDAGVTLAPREREVLLLSIQDFQLGESSDGANPRRMAREYGEKSGDAQYPEAMLLFLAEEHRHSRLLGRYLDLAGAPQLSFSWDDALFRRLRRLLGLELMLMTLLMAETIAKVYYRALHDASDCPLLRRICTQLLRDEKRHVEFHIERLHLLSRHRSFWWRFMTQHIHSLLFAGTCLVVWLRHGNVFRLGGYNFRSYWQHVWREFEKILDSESTLRHATGFCFGCCFWR